MGGQLNINVSFRYNIFIILFYWESFHKFFSIRFVLQGTFSASELSQGQSEFFYDELISINTITIAVIAPFVIFIVNEFLIKRQEIL